MECKTSMNKNSEYSQMFVLVMVIRTATFICFFNTDITAEDSIIF